MIRGALFALFFALPLGCSVNPLPGAESNRLGSGDGGTNVDLGPGNHGDGGGCGGGGNVDLAGPWPDGGGPWPDGGGYWNDGGAGDGFFVDAGPWPDGGPGGWDAGSIDGGAHVDLAH